MVPQKNEKDKEKKQVLLRLSQTLWTDLADWAEDDFRSINGQIEYLLTEAVRKRKRGKRREAARRVEEGQME
ncbi:MAG: Arc family DNA-binding protein [Lachnospiraceae bacterium]|nr:Arc family DNA-binding protein [Lachnospiraceae bacterium]